MSLPNSSLVTFFYNTGIGKRAKASTPQVAEQSGPKMIPMILKLVTIYTTSIFYNWAKSQRWSKTLSITGIGTLTEVPGYKIFKSLKTAVTITVHDDNFHVWKSAVGTFVPVVPQSDSSGLCFSRTCRGSL